MSSKIKRLKNTILAASALAVFSVPALANEEQRQDMLNLAVGYYDAFDEQDGIDLRIEYRPDSKVYLQNLKPWLGLELTLQGSLWAGGGLLYDWNFADNWYLTPILGVGLYTDGGSDKDLAHPIEFRSQIEVSYKFENDWRLGLSLSHMSNAGLNRNNPGTEVVSLNWSYPL